MKHANKNDTTHFGYQQVNSDKKEALVGQVFDSVAPSYDLMNDVMSLGIHRLWKRFTIAKSGVRQGDCVLDVAGGTGDLTLAFSKRVGKQGHVILGDINSAMLKAGRNRLENKNITHNVQFTELNAECLPFLNDTFDVISIAFGLRNVTHIPVALQSLYRVLKPGGRLLVLEFSTPTVNWIKPLYDKYSFSILPKLGKWLAKDSESYQYLAESIRMHPDQDTLSDLFLNAGFDQCHYHNLTGGIVALHVGTKY